MDHLHTRHTRLAIVGMGFRGLSVLEQLLIRLCELDGLDLRIEVFEPRLPGSGLHSSDQPDYLMLNTIAGQIQALVQGPDFLQWCQAQALRLDARGHVCSDEQGRAIGFGDFLPRRLLGQYLEDCWQLLLARCPAGVTIVVHTEQVIGAKAEHGTTAFLLETDQGRCMQVDGLILTTGHGTLAQPEIGNQHRVAIEGLGLSAMDLLAQLTEGRGGRFVRAQGQWRYQRSGQEPQIDLYSRSGLPFHARPQWQAPTQDRPPALFFTTAAIEQLRQQHADRRLDFDADLLPLIEDEMRCAFYRTQARLDGVDSAALESTLQAATQPTSRAECFARLAYTLGPFEPRDWMPTERWSGDPQHYGEWFRQWISRDLADSHLGTSGSPLKAALEVWRDCREQLRQAVDRNGLNEASTLRFFRTWAGLSNRLVGGPQKERYEDLLALIEAGVVRVLAPDAREIAMVDCERVIVARVPHSGLRATDSALMHDLQAQGLIRAAHPGPADGIVIDNSGRASAADGRPQQRLWVLGPAVEGCTFYNHYVATPDPQCAAIREARLLTADCLEALGIGQHLAVACA
ncbi:FAD-NAD(P)-binding domain protein [Pseudomonas brassicacearum]|uniref:FAD-NAD(P)-binding domain protein n=1 Tax=Pseudomonas brassicacearum TaxID=930166 RepID=A0A423GZT5_9PSED|nr:FAD/NAD(P)-binding domain-containing protein [Pseudomonas brassicacearum]RON03898.1 FAD-NAD(P)-binding domain protein [Pseudomonas brassicacearum]